MFYGDQLTFFSLKVVVSYCSVATVGVVCLQVP